MISDPNVPMIRRRVALPALIVYMIALLVFAAGCFGEIVAVKTPWSETPCEERGDSHIDTLGWMLGRAGGLPTDTVGPITACIYGPITVHLPGGVREDSQP